MSDLTFILGAPTITLNELRKMHHRVYARHRAALAFEVSMLTIGRRPHQPFARACVRIERHSARSVDQDGAYGGLKPLLDVLQPFHPKIRPASLGIIADDSPQHLTLDLVQVQCPRGQGKTVVMITEVPS